MKFFDTRNYYLLNNEGLPYAIDILTQYLDFYKIHNWVYNHCDLGWWVLVKGVAWKVGDINPDFLEGIRKEFWEAKTYLGKNCVYECKNFEWDGL